GKTGSTQLPYNDIDGTKDQWFVGYTPNLVGAVWLGYDKTDREHYLAKSSSETVVPVFIAIIDQSIPHIEQAEFSAKSINDKMEEQQNKEEMEQNIKEQAEKIEGKIKEELPKWKEKLNEGAKELIEFGEFLKEK